MTGLHGVSSVGGDLTVTNNAALFPASAYALRDAIGLPKLRGAVTISGNGP